ncbi:hypothetical protein NMY22_g3190 [Coprinellus aureogranulatus]|nr:hypothetical protein NMY22_g3190 [Coprinellus aureogranulatus]
MSSLSYLPLQQSELPITSWSLITTFLNTSSWIWAPEHPTLYPPPLAPGSSQRAFRFSYTNSFPLSKTASSTTIVITADNYFELFVNGILLHAADPQHHWEFPLLFTVPIEESPSHKVTYAIRAINAYNEQGAPDPSFAGLRAAIQIDFSSPSNPDGTPPTSEVIYTGGDRNWRSSHVFGSGWEQPEFDDAGLGASEGHADDGERVGSMVDDEPAHSTVASKFYPDFRYAERTYAIGFRFEFPH